jgi:hypothetical protein
MPESARVMLGDDLDAHEVRRGELARRLQREHRLE